MEIQTALSIGDKVWAWGDYRPRLLTVGQVRVQITDSPGVNDGHVHPECRGVAFDNYKPQADRKEEYMCVESGIGSGTLWELGRTIFRTEDECIAANAEAIERRRVADEECKQRERRDLLRQEPSLREQLARIDKIKAEAP